jgi:hypothetical protein
MTTVDGEGLASDQVAIGRREKDEGAEQIARVTVM